MSKIKNIKNLLTAYEVASIKLKCAEAYISNASRNDLVADVVIIDKARKLFEFCVEIIEEGKAEIPDSTSDS